MPLSCRSEKRPQSETRPAFFLCFFFRIVSNRRLRVVCTTTLPYPSPTAIATEVSVSVVVDFVDRLIFTRHAVGRS